MFVFIGAAPEHRLARRASWRATSAGFILTGPDLADAGRAPALAARSAPPLLLETSLPGVFVAGDVRHQSIKRVAAAVGEGSMAVQLVHQYLGTTRVIDAVRQVRPLRPSSRDDVPERLAAAAREERHGAGEWLFREGEPADRFGVLTEGLIEWVRMVDGEEVVLGRGAADHLLRAR